MSLHPNRGMTWEPVAVPVAKGIDLRTRARLVSAQNLLSAQNCQFPLNGGVSKRYGNFSKRLRSQDPLPLSSTVVPSSGIGYSALYADKTVPANWVYGWGLFDPTNPQAGVTPYPDAGVSLGAARRDDETLLWDGWRLFSHSPNQSQVGAEATPTTRFTAPYVRTSVLAKNGHAQMDPVMAENSRLRLVAWFEQGSPLTLKYSLYDASTGSPLVTNKDITTVVPALVGMNPQFLRVIPVGDWLHLLVSESASGLLFLVSIHPDTMTWVERSLGSTDGKFDCFKISESSWIVVQTDSAGSIVIASYLGASGIPATSPLSAGTSLALSGTKALNIALAVHPLDGTLGILHHDNSGGGHKQFLDTYTPSGVLLTHGQVGSLNLGRVAIAPGYLFEHATATTPIGHATFACYWDGADNSGDQCMQFTRENTPVTRYGLYIAAQAFRVGHQTFCPVGYKSASQSSFGIVDELLSPVAKWDYGTGVINTADSFVPGTNWSSAGPVKDISVYHGALGFNVRLPAPINKDTGQPVASIFSESSIRSWKVDFLSRLRSATAGRAAYFAGGQVWQYDGENVTEADFHLGPETVTMTSPTSVGGNMVAGNKYYYYIVLCRKNAQGEEIRSAGFFTNQITIVGNSVQLQIGTLPLTRWPDAYFLIYRNQNNGVQWNLVSPRDPASAPSNHVDIARVSYVDLQADTAIIANELSPANSFTYIEEHSSPACEIIAAGRDRLWVAGGECAPGEFQGSRLFQPGQVPSFSPALGNLVDRGNDPITALGTVDDVTLIFREDRTYMLEGDGPDNQSNGSWPSPRLALAETGAVGQEGTALISSGLLFQSPAGFRLVGPGGQLQPIGVDIDPIARSAHVSAAIVVPRYQQVRIYSPDGDAMVYDYLQGTWSTFTGVECWGAVLADTVILARPDGYVFVEDEDTFTDGGKNYEMKVKSSWLHADNIGSFQRVRKVGLLGDWDPANPFTLTMNEYFNEKSYPEEVRTWDLSDDLNVDQWGNANWGDGNWGDTVAGLGEANRDDVLRAVFRIGDGLQKCSVIALEFSDGGVAGSGFGLTAFLLEIGQRAGLDRVPARTSAGVQSGRSGGGGTGS